MYSDENLQGGFWLLNTCCDVQYNSAVEVKCCRFVHYC